ncbi:BQ5605_C025g09988 [Microbotryum silenes-dioicae]|uniref:BQ5605_C025g09988 protein n=1 Tax=Microbotryum silenes-dioicae TaxID=796604 RepID=A0A2X0N8G2_9BASI|nr:BQ5605_C025g09988 [Microbotryum silenes-dioicae]
MTSTGATSSPVHADTVQGGSYITELASFVRRHESKLADFGRRPTPSSSSLPAWSSILSLGIIASSDASSPVASHQRKAPLVLEFDPHHLYFLLLKFDELGIANLGDLDVRIQGGVHRPMMIDYGLSGVPEEQASGWWAGAFGGGGSGSASTTTTRKKDSDTASFRSGISSFSIGSGWWGSTKAPVDESVDVKYLYASCTKLPALKLSPFITRSRSSSPKAAGPLPGHHASPLLSKAVQDFQDCPPDQTTVPLYAFKNLQSLILEDLDPRGFLGWDVMSAQLRSLQIHRSGIEDIGELICDVVVEDVERRKKGAGQVGQERIKRQKGPLSAEIAVEGDEEPEHPAHDTSFGRTDDGVPPSPSTASYPIPPRYAWSQLRHLSLSHNSLTFVPTPPLHHLASSLTSLDLSSNLLISVPTGLSALHSLRSLNLSDNMIDSLVGISKILGAVQVLNLSHNRLSNLAGLDRLLALERIDVRSNRLQEALEISRLQELPLLREVWVQSNPFTRSVHDGGEEGWKNKCMAYFEGGQVTFDDFSSSEGQNGSKSDSRGSSTLRRSASAAAGLGMADRARTEEARTAGEAKIVSRRVVTTPHQQGKHHRMALSPPPSPLPNASMGLTSTSAMESSASPTSSPSLGPTKVVKSSQPAPTSTDSAHRKPRRIVNLDGPSPRPGGDSSGLSDVDHHHHHHQSPKLNPGSRTVKSLSSVTGSSLTSPSKPSARRQRLSASTFEPPISYLSTSPPNRDHSPSRGGDLKSASSGSGSGPENSGEAFRKKIEQLRNEVGESWLSVLGERQEREAREAARAEGSANASASASASGGEANKVVKRPTVEDAQVNSSPVTTKEDDPVAEEAVTTATVTKVVKAHNEGDPTSTAKKGKKKKKSGKKK